MDDGSLTCPSGQPNHPEAQVLGVVSATPDGPRVAYVAGSVPVTTELLALAGDLPVNRVMRFASPCAGGGCMHFDGHDCQLAKRIVDQLDPVVGGLPPCAIRRTCRWFTQEGGEACARCPRVVTVATANEPELAAVAQPR